MVSGAHDILAIVFPPLPFFTHMHAQYLSHTTVQAEIAGTGHWMAPEVMETMEANINKKCDSFSYGMVVYELLVHKVLYDAHLEIWL